MAGEKLPEDAPAREAVRPRRMALSELVDALVEEHGRMREGLARARAAAAAGDFEGVGGALKEVDLVFRQHMADEEAQVLGLLIAKLGVKGAEAEIAVFRQHRPIYGLMQKIGELAGAGGAELEARQSELDALFDQHSTLEETRVFPKAMKLVG